MKHLWHKLINCCCFAVLSSQQMTVGKIYCAKLIYENYKYMKKKQDSRSKVFKTLCCFCVGVFVKAYSVTQSCQSCTKVSLSCTKLPSVVQRRGSFLVLFLLISPLIALNCINPVKLWRYRLP